MTSPSLAGHASAAASPSPQAAAGGRALGWILLLGLALRLIGIGWGLPSTLIPGEPPFHPDEMVPFEEGGTLYSAPDPITFTWGGVFYFRLGWLARALAESLHPGNATVAAGVTVILLRLLNVLLGVLTGAMVYRVGALLYGRRVGLLAAFLLLSFPAHVLESHYARPDVVELAFAAASLVCAATVARAGERADLRWLVAGGLLAGLAIATMLWGVLAVVPLGIAVGLSSWEGARDRFLRRIVAGGVVLAGSVALGYALGSIETFCFWKVFLAGRARAAAMHGSAGYHFPAHLLGATAFFSFGTVTTLAAYAGVFMHLRSGRLDRAWILVGHLVAGAALLVAISGDMMRYVLFLAPSIALLGAYAIDAAIEWVATRTSRGTRIRKLAYGAIGIATLQVPLSYLLPMQFQEDARHRAGRWVARRSEGLVKVGITPSFYGDWTYVARFPERPARGTLEVHELMLRSNFDASGYLDRGLDFIAISDFTLASVGGDTAPAFVRGLVAGDRYRLAARFAPPWEPLCLPVWMGFERPADLLYLRQSLSVFERVDRTPRPKGRNRGVTR